MDFSAIKLTQAGNLLLKSKSQKPKPVSNPTNAFLEGKLSAVIYETIGRESDPIFLAKPHKGVDPKALVGKTLATAKTV